jgi:ABC-type polysaccharide/polyol phosphate export permease
MWDNLAALPRYRGLIQSLVARELKARYRGSVLGMFWSFGNPILLLTVYSIVFNYFQPPRTDIQPYALFLCCGLLPWTWFASSLNESANSLLAGGNLIKKVLFPAEVLPIVSVLANMVQFLLALPILAGFLIYYANVPIVGPDGVVGEPRVALHAAELIWLPLVVLVQLVLTTGLALLLSALTVHFRDIRDILSNLLTLWFFATPIIYSWRVADSPKLKLMLDVNPFTHLAVSYQEILFHPENAFGHVWWLLALGAASIGIFFAGYWVFDRLRDSFAEVV